MTVQPMESSGNSSKFQVVAKSGEFTIALSFTLRTKIWQLANEQESAELLAEAIVSRHDPKLPLRKIYIFAEHNTDPTFEETLTRIRKRGYE